MIKKVDWNDKKAVLAIVQQNGMALYYASAKLQNDKEVVLTAVQQNGWALEYASAALRNDKDVVLAAVQQDGMALEYASAALRNDKDVVLAAVQQDGDMALKYASEELRNDKAFIVELIKKTGNKEILYYVGEKIDIFEKHEILLELEEEIDAQENLFELSDDATSDIEKIDRIMAELTAVKTQLEEKRQLQARINELDAFINDKAYALFGKSGFALMSTQGTERIAPNQSTEKQKVKTYKKDDKSH